MDETAVPLLAIAYPTCLFHTQMMGLSIINNNTLE